MTLSLTPTSKLRRLVRGSRVVFHLLCGLLWVGVAFPFFFSQTATLGAQSVVTRATQPL